MKMKKASICVILLLVMTLCGCAKKSPEEISATTVYINNDGSIEATFVEDFSQSYYDMTELQNMANEEVAAFNADAGDEKIAITFYEVNGNIAKMQMTFTDAESYSAYVKEDLFAGTVAEALEAGYDLKYSLINPENADEVIGEHELLTMQDSNIVIVENAVRVRTQSKMQYMSADAVYIDEYEVDGYDNPDATVILY